MQAPEETSPAATPSASSWTAPSRSKRRAVWHATPKHTVSTGDTKHLLDLKDIEYDSDSLSNVQGLAKLRDAYGSIRAKDLNTLYWEYGVEVHNLPELTYELGQAMEDTDAKKKAPPPFHRRTKTAAITRKAGEAVTPATPAASATKKRRISA